MDKTIVGVLSALGALAVAGPTHASGRPASVDDVMQAQSYADLLKPIPNAAAVLRDADAAPRAQTDDAHLVPAGYYHHHHHHHHHRYYHRYY